VNACGGDVVIVLATYNGAAYLREQIRSIQDQTESRWRLLIRDDGSTDATRAIIDELIRADSRIECLDDDDERLGPAGNFGALLTTAFERGANYVCCADQDDVWLPNKLAVQLDAMRRAETSLPLILGGAGGGRAEQAKSQTFSAPHWSALVTSESPSNPPWPPLG